MRLHIIAAGTATGLSLDSLFQWLAACDWKSFLNLAGCVVATGISWYISVRTARREQDRLDAQERREQLVADRLAEIHLEAASAERKPPEIKPTGETS